MKFRSPPIQGAPTSASRIDDPERLRGLQEVEDPERIRGIQEVEDPQAPPIERITTETRASIQKAQHMELRRRFVRRDKPDEYSGFIILRLSPELSCEGKERVRVEKRNDDEQRADEAAGEDGAAGAGEEAVVPEPARPDRPPLAQPAPLEPAGEAEDLGADSPDKGLWPLPKWIDRRFDLKDEEYRDEEKLEIAKKRAELVCLGALLEECPPRRLIQRLKPQHVLALEQLALASPLPPLHSLASYWRLDARHLPERQAEDMVRLLNELPEVDLAYRELRATDTQTAASSGPVSRDPYAEHQHYLDPAPVGIDARWASRQPNGTGDGTRFVDLEQGWVLTHRDLPAALPLIYGHNRHQVGPYRGNHGTAVLGELIAQANGVGVVGIAPQADGIVVSHYHSAETPFGQFADTNGHVADAIVAAVARSRIAPAALSEIDAGSLQELEAQHLQAPQGDVLLVEAQRSGKPTEVDEADFDAIRLASALGTIVVEAAGNGGVDLDAYVGPSGDPFLNRRAPYFRDSGAVMVGAAESELPHNRAPFSNFGSRLESYAWGEEVVTCGYGDLYDGQGDPDQFYTQAFSGTSAAAPVVAGAALILQGMHLAATGTRLGPGEMRTLLSDPRTATPQGGGVPGAIGVMPDLRAIVQGLGLAPNLYVRDGAGETGGNPPAPGPTGPTPDIQVDPVAARPRRPAAYQFTLQLRNRGLGEAKGVTATLYGSDASTLITPDMWQEIGTTTPLQDEGGQPRSVHRGDTPVPTRSLTWSPKGSLLPPGNFSFLALLGRQGNPAPPLPPGPPYFDWDLYLSFLRQCPGLGFRQVEGLELPFLICGTPDRSRVFDFEIYLRLPVGATVKLQVPPDLAGRLNPAGLGTGERTRGGQIELEVPARPCIRRSGVRLAAAGDWRVLDERAVGRSACRFRLTAPGGKLEAGASVLIRQLFLGQEVGRVTWQFG